MQAWHQVAISALRKVVQGMNKAVNKGWVMTKKTRVAVRRCVKWQQGGVGNKGGS